MMRVLDLFSGIGGFSLGLERTGGFKTVAFCEIEPFCRKVLAKHWPEVPCYHDVRELTAAKLAADGISVDVICGGFPCQDISTAGKGAGIDGERSGLWSEYARLVGEVRPAFVLVENVAALLSRGLDRVLGDLAALGFDAEWHCIPASAVGAPHRRDRVWLMAYPGCISRAGWRAPGHLVSSARTGEIDSEERQWNGNAPDDCRTTMADPNQPRLEGWLCAGLQKRPGERVARESCAPIQHDAHDASIGTRTGRGVAARDWRIEPDVGRVANGVPSRVDRLRALGNAVVPQIPELIGKAILAGLTDECALE